MKLLQALRALLAPALCERCGQTWTASHKAPAPSCPVCGYGTPAPAKSRPS